MDKYSKLLCNLLQRRRSYGNIIRNGIFLWYSQPESQETVQIFRSQGLPRCTILMEAPKRLGQEIAPVCFL